MIPKLAWWGLLLVLGSSAASASESTRLLGLYNAWVEEIDCLTAGGKAHVGGEGQKDRAFRFSLAVQQPQGFRMQGRFGAMAQIFDLSTNAEGWVLYLPQARQVVRGSSEVPALELLNPKDFLDVLMLEPILLTQGDESGVLSWHEGFLRVSVPPESGEDFHRVIDIDRKTGYPLRLEIRRESRLEEPLVVATYSGYQGSPGFPRSIHVEHDGAWAIMDIKTFKSCDGLDPRRFRIKIPYGTEEISRESLSYDFLPEAERKP